jgi:hypothetical protein
MISVFPTLHPEETLYSAIGRYQELFDFPAARSTSVTLFATRNHTAVAEFPGLLDVLVSRLPRRAPYTADQLIRQHTVLPYYGVATPVNRYRRAVSALRGKERSRVDALLGIGHSGVRRSSHLRFCPQCVANDRVIAGEAYWRREHQLPGVLLCPHHAVPLASGVKRRTEVRRMFVYETLVEHV